MSKNQSELKQDKPMRIYGGFFTEDAKENLTDVINFVDFLSAITETISERDNDDIVTSVSAKSIFNILLRELIIINSDLHCCGGIFSWHDALMAGITEKPEATSN